jgi:hypothetical protein
MSYTLRDLPLPAKVVVSTFLMAVGIGYTSAMVQLHVKDSRSGKPMPTVEDVVRKYTGKKRYDPNAPPPVSKFVQLVSAPRAASWGANSSMAPAFFERDNGEWDDVTGNNPAELPRLRNEREGEQAAAELWGRAQPEARKTAYEKNAFAVDPKDAPRAITPKFKNADGTVRVKDLIEARCTRCHRKGGSYPGAPFQSYSEINKYLTAPEARKPKEGSEWVDAETPVSIESLTQSTHTHLLSFAVLFSLTGLIFAFSNYPTGLRCVLGPWVVIAVVADVSLWWLARLCSEWGPYFAMGIIGTGGLAGAGLFGQIVLSLFNMYGTKGKLVIGGFLAAGAVVAGLVWVNQIDPALNKKPDDKVADANGNGPQAVPKPDDKKDPPKVENKNPPPVVPVPSEPAAMERLLGYPIRFIGIYTLPLELMPFTGGDDGNMARAFFDKEKVYRNRINAGNVPQAEKDKLHAEREGERKAFVAWIRTADPARKAAYESDGFVLPPDLAGKALTPEYVKAGKFAIKSAITDRCARCHSPEGKQMDFPLTTYEEITKYLNPPAPAGK